MNGRRSFLGKLLTPFLGGKKENSPAQPIRTEELVRVVAPLRPLAMELRIHRGLTQTIQDTVRATLLQHLATLPGVGAPSLSPPDSPWEEPVLDE